MPTFHRNGLPVKPAVADSSLILVVNGTPYLVQRIDPDPAIASRAYQLTKPDGGTYHVALTIHGPGCTCPDFTFRREGRDPAGCKHVRACRAWGLLPDAPAPTPRPRLFALTAAGSKGGC